jgi:hypothetical protein
MTAVEATAPGIDPNALAAAPALAQAPIARQPTDVLRWVKIALGVIAVLIVLVVVITLLFGTGCREQKGQKTNLLCAISDFGQRLGDVVRTAAQNIWLIIGTVVAGVAAFFGLGRRGGGGDTPTGGGGGDDPNGGGGEDPNGGGDDPNGGGGEDPNGGGNEPPPADEAILRRRQAPGNPAAAPAYSVRNGP